MATKLLVNTQNAKLISLLAFNKPGKNCWFAISRLYRNKKSAKKDAGQTKHSVTYSSEDVLRLNKTVNILTKEVKELKEKNEELMEKHRICLEDRENLGVRMNKQIANAKAFSIQSLCKDLVEVADIFCHATEAVPKDQLNGGNPHLKNLYEGLTMTNAYLLQVFKRHGLEPMNPLNEKFNPNLHEALFQKANSSVEPNTIVEVKKLGYKLHDRIIRPALVGVSKSK